MADRKISDLTALTTPASGDYVPIVDISEAAAASKNKRITIQSLFQGIPVNVGIGTSSPGAKLHVETIPQAVNQSGSVLFGPNTDCGLEIRNVIDGSGYPRVELRAPVAGAGPMLFFAGGATERLRIDSSGRVGIGTTSPSATLELSGTGTVFKANTATTTSTAISLQLGGLVTSSNSGCFIKSHVNLGSTLNSQLSFEVNGGALEAARIDSSGNVGIGVSSPGAKLDLAAGTGASVTAVLIRSAAANANGFQIVTDSTTDNVYLNNFYNAALRFGTNNTERLRIDSSGRLLVGTSSDSGGALLQVNGDRIRVGTAKTPATSGATGAAGEIAWDANYIYVCTATNTWKRVAIATW